MALSRKKLCLLVLALTKTEAHKDCVSCSGSCFVYTAEYRHVIYHIFRKTGIIG